MPETAMAQTKSLLRRATARESMGQFVAAATDYTSANAKGGGTKAKRGAARARDFVKAAAAAEGAGGKKQAGPAVWVVSASPLPMGRRRDGEDVEGQTLLLGVVATGGTEGGAIRQLAAEVLEDPSVRDLTTTMRQLLHKAAVEQLPRVTKPRMVIVDGLRLPASTVGLIRGVATGLGLSVLLDDEGCTDLAPLALEVAEKIIAAEKQFQTGFDAPS